RRQSRVDAAGDGGPLVRERARDRAAAAAAADRARLQRLPLVRRRDAGAARDRRVRSGPRPPRDPERARVLGAADRRAGRDARPFAAARLRAQQRRLRDRAVSAPQSIHISSPAVDAKPSAAPGSSTKPWRFTRWPAKATAFGIASATLALPAPAAP